MSTLLPLVLTCALETRGVDFAQRLAPFETVFLTALRVRVDVGGVSKSEVEAGVRTMMCDLHNLCEDQPKVSDTHTQTCEDTHTHTHMQPSCVRTALRVTVLCHACTEPMCVFVCACVCVCV